MPKRQVIASITGPAAILPVAWGLRGLMHIGACGGKYTPDCPPEATPFIICLLGGVALIIGSSYAGGRFSFWPVFPAIAAGAAWNGVESSGGERVGAFVLAAVFLVVTAAPFLFAAKARGAARLVNKGAPAIGTVLAVQDTGITVKNDPRVKLRLRIEPRDGSAAFEGDKTITASRADPPYAGKRYPAWFDRADRATFVIGFALDDTQSPQVRELFALAAAQDPGRPGQGAEAAADPVDRLAKLNELRQSGALTETEFEAEKRKLLDVGDL